MEQRSKRRRLGPQAWRDLLERFGSSGLTVEAFCRGEAISAQSFYRWRARLGASTDSGRLPVAATVGCVAASDGFVDLGRLGVRGAGAARLELKLDLGNGLILHLVRG